MFGDKKPTINQELLPVSETTILEIPPHRRADEIGALRVSVNLTFLVASRMARASKTVMPV
jgi:hypothetical protein